MDIEKQKAALLTSQASLIAQINDLRANLEVNPDEIDGGDDDETAALFTRERDEAMLLEIEGRLEEVNRALEKIAEGSYGKCDRDGKPIIPERLIAIPEATLCVDCKAMEEIF